MADGRSSELRHKAISYDIYCSSCGETKKGREFYTSRQVEHDNNIYHKHYPICKKCIKNKIYRKDGQLDKDEFKNELKKLNLPFRNVIYLKALEDTRESFGTYISLLNTSYKNNIGLMNWDDGVREEEKNNNTYEVNANNIEEVRIYNKKWTGNYTKTDIEYLDNYLEGLSNDFKIITTNHRDYAKKISQLSLAVNKAYQGMLNDVVGADKKYDTLQKSFDLLSKSAQFSENTRSANDAGISGISQIVDKIESKEWIYEVEDIPKDGLDHLLDQFSNIKKSL